MLLLRTPIGSRLYNTHHEHSDWDTLEVYANTVPSPSRQIKQKIRGDQDVVQMNLSTFMNYAYRSSHQILECMFSQQADIDLIRDMRLRYFINTGTFVSLYRRTIKAFALSDSIKSVRHAMRMTYNLQEGISFGRFNPTMSEERRQFLLNSDMDTLRAHVADQVPLT